LKTLSPADREKFEKYLTKMEPYFKRYLEQANGKKAEGVVNLNEKDLEISRLKLLLDTQRQEID